MKRNPMLVLSFFLMSTICSGELPQFVVHQPELFVRGDGQAVAWADFDLDGDLDLVVGFKNRALALYRNDEGEFIDIAGRIGLTQQPIDTRSLSWGDFNRDGWPDLYLGFGRDTGVRNKLYQNREGTFVEVGEKVGVNLLGTSRQASWIDFDNDGDVDLFVAMRDRQSRMLRNDDQIFVDVSKALGLFDPRRSVGAVWFDFDQDGDLDLFLANQSGDTDALYLNEGDKFVDIASKLGISRLDSLAGRDLTEGSVGATVCDFDNNGWFDLFVPSYGPDVLYMGHKAGRLMERGKLRGVRAFGWSVGADCGDLNNDGWSDIYLAAYAVGETHGQDAFYWNNGKKFVGDFPEELNPFDADHGVRFADFDNDGDLDIALTNRATGGRLSLLRNDLKRDGAQSLAVRVVDSDGFWTRQGSEVRVFDSNSGALIGSGLVDTGGGYISQNMIPVHIGLGNHWLVDVEVTAMSNRGRITKRIDRIDVQKLTEPVLTIPI